MTDQLISFETAKLAKKKGFLQYPNLEPGSKYSRDFPPQQCTQSLLQKWLREVHKTDITINVSSLTNEYWSFIPRFIGGDWKSNHFKTYEAALEQGLYQALLLIKQSLKYGTLR